MVKNITKKPAKMISPQLMFPLKLSKMKWFDLTLCYAKPKGWPIRNFKPITCKFIWKFWFKVNVLTRLFYTKLPIMSCDMNTIGCIKLIYKKLKFLLL
jgi:hypothetical protein